MITHPAIMFNDHTGVYDDIFSDFRPDVYNAARHKLRTCADRCICRANGSGMNYREWFQIVSHTRFKQPSANPAISQAPYCDHKEPRSVRRKFHEQRFISQDRDTHHLLAPERPVLIQDRAG